MYGRLPPPDIGLLGLLLKHYKGMGEVAFGFAIVKEDHNLEDSRINIRFVIEPWSDRNTSGAWEGMYNQTSYVYMGPQSIQPEGWDGGFSIIANILVWLFMGSWALPQSGNPDNTYPDEI